MMMYRDVTISIELVTPDIAKKLLEKNTGNFRELSQRKVNSIARDMKAGAFQTNGDAIRFGYEDGKTEDTLFDGQHRLHATVKSNTAHEMLIIRNLPIESVQTMDTGTSRTASQWLKHRGVKAAPEISAVARCNLYYEMDTFYFRRVHPTASQVIEYVESHEKALRESLALVRCCRHIGANIPTLASVIYLGTLGTTQGWGVADGFIDQLASGAGLTEYDPVLHFRNRLMRQTTNNRIDRPLLKMYTVRAWNMFVREETCRDTKFRITLAGKSKTNVDEHIEVAE